ncbi:uncharacterized protein LOC115228355 [Octopus sinensis]|uniref:Uncharacterized protein LOC115228355 n=1 Tax=Octopus sinensis TaxID=2607531 RepID=A0A6P7TSS3_9MOLL|nr:uncharacterized protein LOC115228355 [Octopus sinensis]
MLKINVGPETVGEYLCVLNDLHAKFILDAPGVNMEFKHCQSTVTVDYLKTAYLACFVTNGSKYTTKWIKDGQYFENESYHSRIEKTKLGLLIRTTEVSDQGIYYFLVFLGNMLIKTKPIRLIVNCIPQFLSTSWTNHPLRAEDPHARTT